MSPTTGSSHREEEETPHLNEEECEDLILGVLPEAEIDRILKHACSCSSCEALLQKRSAYWEHLRTRSPTADGRVVRRRIRADVHGFGWRQNLRALFGGRRLRLGFGLGLAAGTAAVLWMTLTPSPQPDLGDLPLPWLPPLGDDVRFRHAAPKLGEDLVAGLEAYAERELSRAIPRLREAEASGPSDAYRRIYLGNALAQTRRYGEAAAVLEPIPFHLVPEPWAGEGRWTLYVALRGAGQKARADSLLRELVEDSGEVGDRARKLGDPE